MRKALGFFEIRSYVAALYAADIMVKAADVMVRDFHVVGSGVISVVVEGEVAAVKAAIAAAQDGAAHMADVIGVNVIPRPEDDMNILFE